MDYYCGSVRGVVTAFAIGLVATTAAQELFDQTGTCGVVVEEPTCLREALLANVERVRKILDEQQPGFAKVSHGIAEYAYRVHDRTIIDELFQRCIAECVDTDDRYIANLDYAIALTRFGDAKAEIYYGKAIELRSDPRDAYEAYNRYAFYLEGAGRRQEALDLWTRFGEENLQQYPSAALMRSRLMRELSVDASNLQSQVSSPAFHNPIGAQVHTVPTPYLVSSHVDGGDLICRYSDRTVRVIRGTAVPCP